MPRLRGARDCGENAMSLQAMLVRLFMRLTVKRKIHKAEELAPAKVRATIEKMSARTRGKWPDMVKVEPVAVNGVKAYWISTPNSEADKVYYYLHGGGYVFGSPDTTHLDLLWRLAHASKARVFAIDYRKAPENPYPAALDDAVAGYEFLLAAGILPQSIAIGGDSAGGGLTMATLLRLKDEGKDLPSCATLLSPWTDLAATGTTLVSNLKTDMMIPGDMIGEVAKFYSGELDVYTPYISPLYGDHRGLPPIYIQVSSSEVLLDDSLRLEKKLNEAGVPVVVDEWRGMAHVWQAIGAILPEARIAIGDLGKFVRGHMRGQPRLIEAPSVKPAAIEAAE